MVCVCARGLRAWCVRVWSVVCGMCARVCVCGVLVCGVCVCVRVWCVCARGLRLWCERACMWCVRVWSVVCACVCASARVCLCALLRHLIGARSGRR